MSARLGPEFNPWGGGAEGAEARRGEILAQRR